MKRVILILLLPIVFYVSIFAQSQEIVEEMKIKWFVLPVFALDKMNRPVLELKTEDLKLIVNGQEIKDYYLIKRDLAADESIPLTGQDFQNFFKPKKNMIFFVIDLTYSSASSLLKYKEVMRELVKSCADKTNFFIFSISGKQGLIYHSGPNQNKDQVLEVVNGIDMENLVNPNYEIYNGIMKDIGSAQIIGSKGSKYTWKELQVILRNSIKARTHKRNDNFFQSFKFLFYVINSMGDNKFVYLFTKGIPGYSFAYTSGGGVDNRLKSIAKSINNAGAIMSVVNPDVSSAGDFVARQLAENSGAKYFKGTAENIAKQIKNYHKSYYELAFSDIADPTQNTRKISVKSLKSGIDIFTCRSLKDKVKYFDMNEMEKKLHVVNSLLGNIPTTRMIFNLHSLKVLRQTKKSEGVSYELSLPDNFVNRNLDLFLVRLAPGYEGPKIEKKTLNSPYSNYELTIKKGANERVFFMMINGTDLSALTYGVKEQSAKPQIALKNLFYQNQTLKFKLVNYLKNQNGKSDIRITIKAFNEKNTKVFDQTKRFILHKDSTQVSITIKQIQDKNFRFLIAVDDMIAKKSAFKELNVKL